MFGLIGKNLSHSFSQNYFTEKFQELGLSPRDGYTYELFELDKIEDFEKLIKENPNLKGVNVTVPYKKTIIPFLDKLDPVAKKIGAVNTVKIESDGIKTGYNTDYIGFKSSLERFLYINSTAIFRGKALILGTGGAAQAVKVALREAEDLDDLSRLNIKFNFASSSVVASQDEGKYKIIPYSQVNITKYKLIINTTPLGMYPNVDDFPPLSSVDYSKIDETYFLYDLIYNPQETVFLKKGRERGAKTINGLEMLYKQAEAAAQIWGI